MGRGGLVAVIGVVVAGGVALVVATAGSEPSAPAPGDDRGGPHGLAGGEADVPEPRAVPNPRVVEELEQTWEDQEPRAPEHGYGPISDAAWVDHPCHRLADVVVGATDAEPAAAAALVAEVEDHHLRNRTLDVKTWSYAACVAVERDDPAPCRQRLVANVEERCEELLNATRLARAHGRLTAAECVRRLAEVPEPRRMPESFNRLCRAATGDATACDGFPEPAFTWVCDLHLTPEVALCDEVTADNHVHEECRALVDLVRVARGLPAQSGDQLDPGMPISLVYRKLADPALSCAEWYQAQLRELCF
ncbi:MAG: hypothetical protein CVU56_00410 [Deltaproteobacteria bacterium HGW-Deltaproteobacteria-14]|nr:MAG: hypothetical protein CVU56_00410 [Deltaproteobacteria bacterium HGW-Deltaproteobacteria-14]